MKHIIVNFSPFMVPQSIYVYIDGECKENINVPIDQVVRVVHSLQSKYDITNIDLVGNHDYLLQFQNEIGNSQFENTEITILERN